MMKSCNTYQNQEHSFLVARAAAYGFHSRACSQLRRFGKKQMGICSCTVHRQAKRRRSAMLSSPPSERADEKHRKRKGRNEAQPRKVYKRRNQASSYLHVHTLSVALSTSPQNGETRVSRLRMDGWMAGRTDGRTDLSLFSSPSWFLRISWRTFESDLL